MSDSEFITSLAIIAIVLIPVSVIVALLVDEGAARLKARRERHPMEVRLRPFRPATTAQGEPEVTRILDWDTAMDRELAAAVPIPPLEPIPAARPEPAPVMLECAVCGKAFKPRGLPIHTARVHKTPAPGSAASYPQRGGNARGGSHVDA